MDLSGKASLRRLVTLDLKEVKEETMQNSREEPSGKKEHVQIP